MSLERIAESRILIERAHVLTMHASWKMDTVGNKVARVEIAMVKVAAPNIQVRIGKSRPRALQECPTTSARHLPTR